LNRKAFIRGQRTRTVSNQENQAFKQPKRRE